jgi:hypothetical protein
MEDDVKEEGAGMGNGNGNGIGSELPNILLCYLSPWYVPDLIRTM